MVAGQGVSRAARGDEADGPQSHLLARAPSRAGANFRKPRTDGPAGACPVRRLLLHDGFGRAGIDALPAVHARVLIDRIDRVALADRFHRAGLHARAAGCALVRNHVRHSPELLMRQDVGHNPAGAAGEIRIAIHPVKTKSFWAGPFPRRCRPYPRQNCHQRRVAALWASRARRRAITRRSGSFPRRSRSL